MALRRAGTCSVCQAPLAADTRAWWDADARTVTCTPCRFKTASQPLLDAPQANSDATPETAGEVEDDNFTVVPAKALSPEPGAAGASADRTYERLHSKREARIRAAHPRMGGVILALTNDPNTTTAWATGAKGERIVGDRLATLTDKGVASLHDRLIPGTRASNIDHIAIGPSGVFVIDAKNYRGQVTTKTTGTFFKPGPDRLVVGRRDCTKLAEAMPRQVAAVERALVRLDPLPAIVPMLCFTDAEWGFFSKPFLIGGVWVGWPKAMATVVTRPGSLSPEQVNATVVVLAEQLPPA
jgi:hypothetical protein